MVKQAVVTTNLLDLWTEPKFNSERASQLLFGESVRVGAVRKGFARVVQPDGYAGWVDRRFLREIPAKPTSGYRQALECAVIREKAVITDAANGAPLPPHFLLYGTRVRVSARRRGWAVCLLQDGRTFRIKDNSLSAVAKPQPISGADLVREARRFLGVPYLWGGISPAGFDCSGLVRAVFGRFGIYVPRDTKDQIKVGVETARETVRTGDLLFFRRHVGFAIGRDKIIHASMGGSGVRINSLRPGANDYRPDLDRDFASARRIL